MVAQPGPSAAQGFWYGRAGLGEAFHMQFAEHGVGHRPGRWPVASPVETVVGQVDRTRLQCRPGVVARVHLLRMDTVGGEVLVGKLEAAEDLARIWVEQQLGRVEAMPLVWPPGAVRAQAVQQAGFGPGQIAVPHVTASARQAQPCRLLLAGAVEQAQIDGLGMGREHREVETVTIPVRTHRPGATRLDHRCCFQQGRWQACCHEGVHSNITVARGGRSITTERSRPLQATACAVAAPSGVPTLLPP